MPRDPLFRRATWVSPVPPVGYWKIEFDFPLVTPIGRIEEADWAMKFVAWIPPTVATLETAGWVKLVNAVYTGAESDVRYLGPPPLLETAERGVLQAFEVGT